MSSYVGTQNAANSFSIGIYDEGKSDLWTTQFDYQGRSSRAIDCPGQWVGLWSMPGMMCGDPTVPLNPFGHDASDNPDWEPWSVPNGGAYKPFFFTGTCKDSNAVSLGGAVVQGFRTVDDAYIGETQCNSNGVYQLAALAAVAHYLVAYYPGSPDLAGTTVNTLVPS